MTTQTKRRGGGMLTLVVIVAIVAAAVYAYDQNIGGLNDIVSEMRDNISGTE